MHLLERHRSEIIGDSGITQDGLSSPNTLVRNGRKCNSPDLVHWLLVRRRELRNQRVSYIMARRALATGSYLGEELIPRKTGRSGISELRSNVFSYSHH